MWTPPTLWAKVSRLWGTRAKDCFLPTTCQHTIMASTRCPLDKSNAQTVFFQEKRSALADGPCTGMCSHMNTDHCLPLQYSCSGTSN